MPSRRFPKPWSVEPMPSGYRVIDANGIVLVHVYGQPDGAIAVSGSRLTNEEARRISKLIPGFPSSSSWRRIGTRPEDRRKPQPQRFKPVTIGDLIRERRLLEGSLRQLPAGEAPLPQSRDSAPAQAYAGARGGEASGLLEVWCHEQRDL
jgi:hypothetical protein